MAWAGADVRGIRRSRSTSPARWSPPRPHAPSRSDLAAPRRIGLFRDCGFDPASVAELPEPRLPYSRPPGTTPAGRRRRGAAMAAPIEAAIAAIPARAPAAQCRRRQPAQMLGITREVLAGRLASRGDHRAAAAAFLSGAEIEETPSFNVFTDPPAFGYPVRRDVAAALLAGGQGGRGCGRSLAQVADEGTGGRGVLAAASRMRSGRRAAPSRKLNWPPNSFLAPLPRRK